MRKQLSFILALMLFSGLFAFSGSAFADEDYTWIGTAGVSKSEATSIEMNSVYAGDLTMKSSRWFQFTTPAFSGYVHLDVSNLTVGRYIGAKIVNSIDEELVKFSVEKGNKESSSVRLSPNTTYYIQVFDANNYGSLLVPSEGNDEYNGTGNYKVAAWYREDSAGNTTGTAKTISFEKQYVTSIDGKGDHDYFSFVASKTGKFTIHCKNIGVIGGAIGPWFYFQCINEIGEELCDEGVGKGEEKVIEVELRSGAKYYLHFYVWNDLTDEGQYLFSIDAPETSVAAIKLNKSKVTIKRTVDNLKPTYQLKATVYPEEASNKAVTWTSKNPKVATVNSKGKVTALKPGSARIVCEAKDGSGVVATCMITVKQPMVKKITLNKKTATLRVKKTLQLKVKSIIPTDAVDKTVKWTTSNSKVATVNSTGKVTAKRTGSCIITCTARDGSKKYAKCKIIVK